MSETLERIQPGDVRIVNAQIINNKNQVVDVTPITIGVYLYESMFSPFITGSITLTDAMSLSELLPFTGEEILRLHLENPSENPDAPVATRIIAFHIYKMSGRENIRMKNVAYSLHFISLEGFADMNTKLSRTYKGKISDIASLVLKTELAASEQTNEPVVEETSNGHVFTSNFWTPSQILYHLSDQALNVVGNPNYVFFQNREGFVFASTDTLMSAEPLMKFIRDQNMRGVDTPSYDEEMARILDMSTPEFYDYIQRKELGAYGSTAYQMDIDTKTIHLKTRKLTELDTRAVLNNSLIDDNVVNQKSDILTQIVHKNLYNNSPNVEVDHHIRRRALLAGLSNFKTNIKVFGNLNYSVGRVVDLTIYSDKQIDDATPDQALFDEVMSGRYLITSLSHEISTKHHVCNIELSKDSISKQRS